MEEYNPSINNDKMPHVQSYQKYKKPLPFADQCSFPNASLIFSGNSNEAIIVSQMEPKKKTAMQDKNDLDQTYLEQSTKIQNQSHLQTISNPYNIQSKADDAFYKSLFKSNQQLKAQSGVRQPKISHANKMFKVKLKQKNLRKKQHEGYDELDDKNLIQYLYTKQNKIFCQGEETKIQPSMNTPIQPIDKITKKSATNLADVLKIDRHRNQRPITIRKYVGRKQKYTIFDEISCQQSIKKRNTQKNKSTKSNASSQKVQKENKSQLTILKERIDQLQETVFHRVPFLIQMGVKFKYKH